MILKVLILSLLPKPVSLITVVVMMVMVMVVLTVVPRYYTNWTRLVVTVVLPLLALTILNTRIFLGIRSVSPHLTS